MGLLDDAEIKLEEQADEEVLRRSIKKPAFFAVLIDRYEDAFLRKAESIVHNREEAEDIVQEAFAKIYQYAGRFVTVEGALGDFTGDEVFQFGLIHRLAHLLSEYMRRKHLVRGSI